MTELGDRTLRDTTSRRGPSAFTARARRLGGAPLLERSSSQVPRPTREESGEMRLHGPFKTGCSRKGWAPGAVPPAHRVHQSDTGAVSPHLRVAEAQVRTAVGGGAVSG